MIKFSDISNDFIKLKIKKVCIKTIGIIPNNDSIISINDNNELDGLIVIEGVEYNFKNNNLI